MDGDDNCHDWIHQNPARAQKLGLYFEIDGKLKKKKSSKKKWEIKKRASGPNKWKIEKKKSGPSKWRLEK